MPAARASLLLRKARGSSRSVDRARHVIGHVWKGGNRDTQRRAPAPTPPPPPGRPSRFRRASSTSTAPLLQHPIALVALLLSPPSLLLHFTSLCISLSLSRPSPYSPPCRLSARYVCCPSLPPGFPRWPSWGSGLVPQSPPHSRSVWTRILLSDPDPSQEECQEGDSVLFDGLRRQWNRYVPKQWPWQVRQLIVNCAAQAARPLSTLSAERRFSRARIAMTLPTLTWRKVSASSPSPSVGCHVRLSTTIGGS